MATNSPWGASNTAGNSPQSFLVTAKAAGYVNTFVGAAATSDGVFSHSAAGASGTGLHQGWIHKKIGTGSVTSLTIAAGGTGYAPTDKWSLTGGTTQANGTLTVTANVITGFTIDNAGAGFKTSNVAVTITTTAGTTATVRANVGGKAGRVMTEVLIAQASQT